MKKLTQATVFFALILMLPACGDKGNTPESLETEKTKILTNYPWRMNVVTDLNGKIISNNQLNEQTQAIGKYMDFEFAKNNVTKARDRESKHVLNGGTWYLNNDNSILDISVEGFAGKFGVVELVQSKMRLQSSMPVGGVDQETIMVFEPVIK